MSSCKSTSSWSPNSSWYGLRLAAYHPPAISPNASRSGGVRRASSRRSESDGSRPRLTKWASAEAARSTGLRKIAITRASGSTPGIRLAHDGLTFPARELGSVPLQAASVETLRGMEEHRLCGRGVHVGMAAKVEPQPARAALLRPDDQERRKRRFRTRHVSCGPRDPFFSSRHTMTLVVLCETTELGTVKYRFGAAEQYQGDVHSAQQSSRFNLVLKSSRSSPYSLKLRHVTDRAHVGFARGFAEQHFDRSAFALEERPLPGGQDALRGFHCREWMAR